MSRLAQLQVDEAGNAAPVVFDDPARPPTAPSSPKPVRDGELGLAAGLVLGLGGAFLRDNLDDALISQEAAEQTAGVPVPGGGAARPILETAGQAPSHLDLQSHLPSRRGISIAQNVAAVRSPGTRATDDPCY